MQTFITVLACIKKIRFFHPNWSRTFNGAGLHAVCLQQATNIDTNYKYKIELTKGRFQKKKLMEFSIKLAGWVLDAPDFHKKKLT